VIIDLEHRLFGEIGKLKLSISFGFFFISDCSDIESLMIVCFSLIKDGMLLRKDPVADSDSSIIKIVDFLWIGIFNVEIKGFFPFFLSIF